MSSSPIISTLLIYVLFIASTVLSAPKEEIIPQRSKVGELHKTREAEILERPLRRFRNERFDVSREDELLHRLARVVTKTLPKTNDGNKVETKTSEELIVANTSEKTRSLTEQIDESKDLMEAHVTPKDDDDDDVLNDHDELLPTMEKRTTLKEKKSKIDASLATNLPPEIFPEDNRTALIRIASPMWLAALNQTYYNSEEAKTNRTANKTETSTPLVMVVPIASTVDESPNDKPNVAVPTTTASVTELPTTVASTTTILTTSVPTTVTPTTTVTKKISEATLVTSDTTKNTNEPTTMSTTYQPMSSSPSPAELKLHEKKKPVPAPMPASIVTLITAISFAIVSIFIYMGIVIRRRYLEWRYGNRELLVNDFDAADISNFEL